jgi:hypothetical protein
MNGTDSFEYVTLTGPEQQDVFKQTYRLYGSIPEDKRVCSSDTVQSGKRGSNASAQGALVMSVRLTGRFGEKAGEISALAAAMLDEILRSMFPGVADSIAVCPVLPEEFYGEEYAGLSRKLPKAVCHGYTPDKQDIELLIIEDCPEDIGVVSVLMSSGDNVMKILFGPVYRYLQWYAAAEKKSDYLYYGAGAEPACFDFAGLADVSAVFGDTGFQHAAAFKFNIPVDSTATGEFRCSKTVSKHCERCPRINFDFIRFGSVQISWRVDVKPLLREIRLRRSHFRIGQFTVEENNFADFQATCGGLVSLSVYAEMNNLPSCRIAERQAFKPA